MITKSDDITKTTWKIINREVGNKHKKQTKDLILTHCGDNVSDPETVAHIFNDYFREVACNVNTITDNNMRSDYQNLHQPQVFEAGKTFSCEPFSCGEVENIVDSLKNKPSYDIPIYVVKFVKKEIVQVLAHIINSSFITGHFPNLLKISKVVPVFKKGEAHKVENYRPISLLPEFLKSLRRQ